LDNLNSLIEAAKQIGFQTVIEFDPGLLKPEEKVRSYCRDNKCGSYGINYTCPPYSGTLDEINERLRKYRRGIILQCVTSIDVKNDVKGVIKTKMDFHYKVLKFEAILREMGIKDSWGMIGGNCGLCEVCQAKTNKPCRYQEEARVSLESIGIDVVGLLNLLGLDNIFHADKITWTGCVLFNTD
jgi:predicted metal-binding protein